MTEIGLLSEAGAVGFTDGDRAIANAQTLRRCLAYASVFDTVILQHPLEPTLATGVMNGGALATRLGLSGSPAMAELIQLERDLRLVEMTGGRYHASLISTGAALDAIRQAKAKGLRVTCDTAPHYFTLSEGGRRLPHVRQGQPAAARGVRPAGADRRARRRHDRRCGQRPRPAGPGQQAPAVHRGGERHRRAGDAVRAVARADPHGPGRPARPAGAPDLQAGRDPRAGRRSAARWRAGRHDPVRSRRRGRSTRTASWASARTPRSTPGRRAAGSCARSSTAARSTPRRPADAAA